MIKIIEYNEKYEEDVKDLFVELEEYIVSIDEDELDQVGEKYRDKVLEYNLEELEENNGKFFLAIENEKAVGLVIGIEKNYDEEDYIEYKCPKAGRVTELIVTSKVRSKGIGTMLINEIEKYFKSIGCEYVSIDVFAYNKNALEFYSKFGYHPRMVDTIRKL